MEWYEAEVRGLEHLRSVRKPVEAPAVFYGSSTIRLWSTLAWDLGNPRALNLGFGGSTLEACFWFFERLVPPERPSSLVVYAGDNDLGDGRQPDAVVASFRALAGRVRRLCPGISFGFISIKPSPARRHLNDRIRRTNDGIRSEIGRIENAYFIPVFDAMLDGRGNPRTELYAEDQLHLAPAGYRLWTQLLKPYCNRIFNPCSDPCNPAAVSSGQGEAGISQMVQSPPES
jgi:lysophospholipase L1-like esterase